MRIESVPAIYRSADLKRLNIRATFSNTCHSPSSCADTLFHIIVLHLVCSSKLQLQPPSNENEPGASPVFDRLQSLLCTL